MAGLIQICNMALGKLGADPISALTEDNKKARYCNLFFDDLRDELLRMHPWSFAAVRTALASPDVDPPGKWSYAYQLPVNCLSALFLETATGMKSAEFIIEGRILYTGEKNAVLVYTARVEDPVQFDQLFTRALASRLAAELAIPITDSNTKMQAMWTLFEKDLAAARDADAAEARVSFIQEDSWITARG